MTLSISDILRKKLESIEETTSVQENEGSECKFIGISRYEQ